MGKLKKYDSSTDTWTTIATGGGGSSGGGTATMPLGYNFGVYITYKDADEIYVQPGNIDVNGTNVSITTATTHTMTSMVDATADFHYIYLAAAGTITDSATEPAWSDAKFGWYSGDTRCIGAVWVPSATPAVLFPFASNMYHECFSTSDITGIIANLATTVATDSAWHDLTTASDFLPVNATKALVWAYSPGAALNYMSVASIENKTQYHAGLYAAGNTYVAQTGFVSLGASRDLAWYAVTGGVISVRIVGYKIRV